MRNLPMRATVVWACALAGCGYVGEPLYPTANIPSPVVDLNAVERGGKILVVFTIPPLTTDGLPLKEVGALDLRAGAYSGSVFDTDAWANAASPWAIPSPEHPGLVRGEIPVKGYIGQTIVIGVRSANDRGRFSAWSNLDTVAVVAPVPAPADLQARATPKGVDLRWQGADATAWRVFRQAADETRPSPLGDTKSASYLDDTAAFGTNYSYYVQAVAGAAESDIAGPIAIRPEKTFPPATPAGLTAVSATSTIELNWERSLEPDLKEYRLYRAEGDGEFTPLAGGLTTPAYSDAKVVSGRRYRYTIEAVDREGNVSPRSAPAEAVAP